jgi:hypothetical protein
MSGDILPLPQYTLMAWCSVKSTVTTLPLPNFFMIAILLVTVVSEVVMALTVFFILLN